MKSPSNKNSDQSPGIRCQLKNRLFFISTLAFLSTLILDKPLLASQDLFSIVPAGDAAYGELKQLAQAGWLSNKDVAPSTLTRFEVAELIVKAEKNSGEIVVAQNTSASDDTLLPPPENIQAGTAATPTGPVTLTPAQKAATREEAVKSLHSLEEAYQYELKKVKDQVKDAEAKADEVDSSQYDLLKHLNGISQNPTIALHGLGRAFGLSQEFSGNLSPYDLSLGVRSTLGYLDMTTDGTVSKEVKWDFILRLEDSLEPNDSPLFAVRRITMQFNPDWLSATIGDFDEAYTPLTLWNRDTLDLRYMPEMWARQDDITKYESFFNNEPYWPFRGLKLGEDILWPDSDVLRELKASTFVDMIRNGFNDNVGWYFGPGQFTDWVIGGTAGLKSPKWYWGETSWQAGLDVYGTILDEPINSEQPGSSYDPIDPTTWAHQYLTGSVKPDLKVGLGDNFYLGGTAEYAYSSYQDDKLNSQRVITDYAVIGGPYIRFGDSSISLNYLDVEPYYYAPLAQTRQDAVTQLPERNSLESPDLFEAPLRSQYFLSDVPRAGAIFGFYDRTMDNTFPYGLATPNRDGVGLEMDIQTLSQKALKIRGSAYLASEIQSNLVLGPGLNYVAVDAPSGVFPTRNFTYVNFGPSFNLGPSIGFERDIEVGTNFRYEQTNSVLGTLTSTWVIGGVRMDVLPVWEVSAAFSQRNANGTEAGYGGTLWARYSYLFDPSDLGQYSVFNVNGSVQSLRFSSVFKVNRNSSLFLDYDYTTGNMLPNNPSQGTENEQFTEVTYQVEF